MFGFNLCKNLRRALVVVRNSPPLLQLHFPHNPSISLLSSSLRCFSIHKRCTSEQSSTVSHLINSCGLSPESALSASNHFHFKTLTLPDSVLSLLNNLGFSKTEIADLVNKYPKAPFWEKILPKLKFFHSKGFSSSDITNILLTNSSLFYRNLENQIIPVFNFLKNLLHSDKRTAVTILRYTTILNHNVETIASKIIFLRDKGVSEPNIVRLLHYYPGMFTMSFDKVKKLVEEAMDLGFDPSKAVFFNAIASLKGMTKSTWERKVDVYKRWNLSEADILAAFRKHPQFMARSEDTIMEFMDLFVNKLGWESSSIAKCSYLMTYSLEKRLIPRASVLQFLLSRDLIEKNFRSTAIFVYPETKFLKKFVNCYNEAPELIKLYNEKLTFQAHK